VTKVGARSKRGDRQLARRGSSQPRLRQAFRSVPREEFVPPGRGELAYSDAPLPIGEEQAISQSCIVALALEVLETQEHERALERP